MLGWLARRSEAREHLIERLITQVWLIVDYHVVDAGVRVDPVVPLPQTVSGAALTRQAEIGGLRGPIDG